MTIVFQINKFTNVGAIPCGCPHAYEVIFQKTQPFALYNEINYYHFFIDNWLNH